MLVRATIAITDECSDAIADSLQGYPRTDTHDPAESELSAVEIVRRQLFGESKITMDHEYD